MIVSQAAALLSTLTEFDSQSCDTATPWERRKLAKTTTEKAKKKKLVIVGSQLCMKCTSSCVDFPSFLPAEWNRGRRRRMSTEAICLLSVCLLFAVQVGGLAKARETDDGPGDGKDTARGEIC